MSDEPAELSLERAIASALRSAIRDHGPITPENIGSAAKRILGSLRNVRSEPAAAVPAVLDAAGGPLTDEEPVQRAREWPSKRWPEVCPECGTVTQLVEIATEKGSLLAWRCGGCGADNIPQPPKA